MICEEKPAPSILLCQCAWCGAIKTHGGQYVTPSVRLPLLHTIILVGTDGSETQHPVSHGICQECKARVEHIPA